MAAVPEALDIEDSRALLVWLRAHGRLAPGETPRCTNLHGGVSNRTVLVERFSGEAWVLKQALEKLRVAADWHSDPRRIHREALGLRWLARLAPPGAITPLLFDDHAQHLLAMKAVPEPHENWKTMLLDHEPDVDHVRQFGGLLGTIHRRSAEKRETIAVEFDDRSFFESLRLEPYYRYTAAQHPAMRAFFDGLIAETLATRAALVHGDYSPKNILVHRGQLVLLDHEVIHFGDPAFDVGFSLTHLLSKARHRPAQRGVFLEAARLHWQTYAATAGGVVDAPGFASRAVRHTLGCQLARVDGRSPLEYLTAAERDHQRRDALVLMSQPPANVPALIDSFARRLE
jgi:aminoglycoside phosphotransferase (APT) family kinase protein